VIDDAPTHLSSSNSDSDDEDYVIELLPPTPLSSRSKGKTLKNGKRKKYFQLVLTGGIDPPTEKPDDQEVGDTCTPENWKSFYAFHKQSWFGDSPDDNANPTEFESDRHKNSKPLVLTKSQDPNSRQTLISLAVKSPYLQEQLRKFIAIQHYHAVTLSASTTVIGSPFAPLYHHLEDITRYVNEDPAATAADRAQIAALNAFVTLGWPAGLFGDVRGMLSQGFIIYDELWALYKPEDYVVTKGKFRRFLRPKFLKKSFYCTYLLEMLLKSTRWDIQRHGSTT
jgi:hypothetical protein